MDKPGQAWVSLVRLGGCNYKVPVRYGGKSVFVAKPQEQGWYRISAADFIAGKTQIRSDWAIAPWNQRAAEVTESELNWQT